MIMMKCLLNQSASSLSVVNLDATLSFVMWDLVLQKIIDFLIHPVMIKYFGQHIQIISK